MDVFNNRLAAIFQQLESSELVKSKLTTESNVADFLRILNRSVPVSDFDRTIGEFVRFLYNQNRQSFYKYININKLTHLVLLTDGIPITNTLGLKNLIEIRWNRQNGEFIINISATKSITDLVNHLPESKPSVERNNLRGDSMKRISTIESRNSKYGAKNIKILNNSQKGDDINDRLSNIRYNHTPKILTKSNPEYQKSRHVSKDINILPPLSTEQCAAILSETKSELTRSNTDNLNRITEIEDASFIKPESRSWADLSDNE